MDMDELTRRMQERPNLKSVTELLKEGAATRRYRKFSGTLRQAEMAVVVKVLIENGCRQLTSANNINNVFSRMVGRQDV